MITPQEFVERWSQSTLREQQAAQSHFNELCELVGHKTPAQLDPAGEFFAFEEQVTKATGGKGRADVWYKGHFAWEYKGKHKNLEAAYAQLLAYRGDLGNPPLLVVCDFLEYRIYPQWVNTSGLPIKFRNEDLLEEKNRRFIRWLLENPNQFLQYLADELREREKLTENLAYQFAHLADIMRRHKDKHGNVVWQPMQIARFLTKIVFTLFVEDVGLLPLYEGLKPLQFIAKVAHETDFGFLRAVQELFAAMNGASHGFAYRRIPYFNGTLFADSAPGAGDGLEVLDLFEVPGAIQILKEVSKANWSEVNPTIFGTLFEGALDENKRAQLGAHYTGESDIRLIVEPVLMQPLNRLWEDIHDTAVPLMRRFLAEKNMRLHAELVPLYDKMMTALENIRVLDPACGSGNFLYVSLRALKDLEARVHEFFEPLNLPFRDVVTPRQLYGIEKDEFAAKLAHVVVWIGYLQWRYETEGHLTPFTGTPNPRALPNPIVKDKNHPHEPDRIICDDAILRYDEQGNPYEPEWAEVDVIMGNPPFLGDKRMRAELGDTYISDLRQLYSGRIPGGADLVTYWHEKARSHIEKKGAKRAGLLATQSIRTGANRAVLDRVKETGNIFLAWSDRAWVLEGAAVRISVVGFDDGTEKTYLLDGAPVTHINSDLQNTIDATTAKILPENMHLTFQGPVKVGKFDIPDALAQTFLQAKNASGVNNADVVRPWMNGEDIAGRSRQMWIVDFGDMPLEQAQQYEAPFQYIETTVKPQRDKNRRAGRREKWWLHGETVPGLRQAVRTLSRFIATPRVAKFRLFIWANPDILPDSRVMVICRDDDYFWGVLQSHIHEKWAIRLASWHGVGNTATYVASACFETFPFPYPPGKENIESGIYHAVAAAAKQLHEERENWLNPPELLALGADNEGKALRERTLTNLYNALLAYQTGQTNGEKLITAAREFAPRLAQLHEALDHAVLAAYGWQDLANHLRTFEGDEELLRRLLALNLERAKGTP